MALAQTAPAAPRRKHLRLTRIGFAFVLIATILAIVYPFYWMVMGSFLPEGSSIANSPLFFPGALSTGAYESVFGSRPMLLWIANTFLITLGVTLLTLPLALLAAYGLNQFRFRGRMAFIFFVLLTQLLPASALIVPLFLIFRSYGLLDTLFGLVVAYTSFSLPLAIWVLWGYLQSISFEFEEAALIDGCTRLGAFMRVTLPIAVPGVAATALFIFLESWNEYLLALVLTSSSSKWVISLGLFSFIGEYAVQIEQMLAASVITVVPAFLLFATLQRYLRGGLALGGVKG